MDAVTTEGTRENMDRLTSEQIGKLLEDVALIKRAVVGEEMTGHSGLVAEVRDLKNWRSKLDLRVASVTGGVMILGFVIKYLWPK